MDTVNYQCPACGGPLHFVAESGKVQCDFCESAFTPEEVEAHYAAKQDRADQKAEQAAPQAAAPVANAFCTQCGAQVPAGNGFCNQCGAKVGAATAAAPAVDEAVEAARRSAAAQAASGEKADPIKDYLRRSNWDDADSANMVSYTCSSCGAGLMCDVTTAATSCPYCGNPTVVPGKLGGTLKPDYVIPFKLTKDDAVARLKDYYKGKKFLAKAFKDNNHIEEIQGVYVPFWLYDATGSGDATFNARNITTWSDSDWIYTKTDHYRADRSGSMDFNLVPADASMRMPDAHMDAIEPFDYSELKPFSMGYLPGYLTDRYDVSVEDCKQRVEGRMYTSVKGALSDTVTGYMEVDCAQMNAYVDYNKVNYALIPVWMLHTKWNGQDFLFAMNGQTGKLIGDLPVQKSKVASWFAGICIPVAAVIFAALMVLM